jgi:hypothetical protein
MVYAARNALATKLAEIEKRFPEDDLRESDYNIVNTPGQRAAMRAEKARLIAEAKAQAKATADKEAVAQRRKAAEFEFGGKTSGKVDPGQLAMVRSLRSEGKGISDLLDYFNGDEDALLALRRSIELDGIGSGGATRMQARALGARDPQDAERKMALHRIDRVLYPEWAEQAEEEHASLEAAEAIARGADNTTAVQAAQIAAARLR